MPQLIEVNRGLPLALDQDYMNKLVVFYYKIKNKIRINSFRSKKNMNT